MLKSVFLLLMLGCAKNNNVNNFTSIKPPPEQQLDASSCIDSLKERMESAICVNVSVTNTSEYDILLKCVNPEGTEKNYWNTNVFRVSYSQLAYTEEDQKVIDMHTICLDDLWRVEMYPIGNK